MSRRICSLILRFSSSLFAIIHSSFSLNTSCSKVGFCFWTALVVPEAKVVVKPRSPTTDLTDSEPDKSESESESCPKGESENCQDSEG